MENNLNINTRFAPTPSGYLHLGNVFSFILTWLIVRKNSGTIRLRIDDLDFERARHEYIADIIQTLDTLGLDYDYGPVSVDAFRNEFSKFKRLDLYEDYIGQLERTGLLFNCACSKKEIREASGSNNYPGTCLNKAITFHQSETTYRINTESIKGLIINDELQGQIHVDIENEMPFFVIRKKDGMPSYQVASLVDDIHYNINYVIRGIDLLPSTGAQMFVANVLKLRPFLKSKFFHHQLLKDGEEKLTKSQKSPPVFEILSKPEGKAQIFQDFSEWIGLPERVTTLAELLSVFEMSQMKFQNQLGI
ncbi:MAG: glutamate--tRNA ligase family protein [Bacteroidetes bacterium]|nr:glutamate--tRNA ligase family protein [Bacteroidota bacterium]MDA1120729.1 glutamate--tRNA ligase family protein [Bacteroidota bacterium]